MASITVMMYLKLTNDCMYVYSPFPENYQTWKILPETQQDETHLTRMVKPLAAIVAVNNTFEDNPSINIPRRIMSLHEDAVESDLRLLSRNRRPLNLKGSNEVTETLFFSCLFFFKQPNFDTLDCY